MTEVITVNFFYKQSCPWGYRSVWPLLAIALNCFFIFFFKVPSKDIPTSLLIKENVFLPAKCL